MMLSTTSLKKLIPRMNKQIAILGLLLLNSAFVLGGQTKIPENSRIVHIKPGP